MKSYQRCCDSGRCDAGRTLLLLAHVRLGIVEDLLQSIAQLRDRARDEAKRANQIAAIYTKVYDDLCLF
jgi:hypothetical protein